jgi:hypothetical protein
MGQIEGNVLVSTYSAVRRVELSFVGKGVNCSGP